ncbi:hypothetical protein NDU88_001908 [Pleurodeles waltl]|uniref:ribonuclease H n=1 Tax=Pleurodeles waltl TaxID=8319 RepID=A0AAV7V938_PLEWA|nr:hypothetical protein NDU88_001908 [Pleurodeles waltl]
MDNPVANTEPSSQTLLMTIQQQAQELQQLRTENTVYRQAFASRTTVPSVSATTPRFSGDPNKLREFLDALTVYFAFRPSQFVQDRTKVGYLNSALSGPALAWATPLVTRNDPCLSNYSTFVTTFKQMFERPGLEASAEEALCDIQQGNQDVLQYITRFRQLAAETSWVERTLVKLFHIGLREDIKDELVHSARIENLKGLMDQTLTIEYRLNERRMEKKKSCLPSHSVTYCTFSHHTEEVRPEPKGATEEEPMQIDTARGPLSASEREHRRNVFQKPERPELPPHREYDSAIPLEPDTVVPFGRMYSLTEPEKQILKEYLEENLQSGLIAPSSSPAGAPLFFVPKKTKDLRPCIDFRGLNKITIKDRYPLPLIKYILEAVRGAKRFTKLDLRGAYHLLRIKEGDEWKTAFRTPFGHYEYRVMRFGLTNAPSIFQRFMDSIFSDLLQQTVVVYLDDIMNFSVHPEEHSKHVHQVLERLRQHHLFCKPEKCEFDKTEAKYLGYCINQTGVAMDSDKVQATLNWPSPSSIKETQCFLGLTNFYRQFIADFAQRTSYITQTLKKDHLKKGFCWTQDAELAFQDLKKAFIQAPILRHPDTSKQFIVVADASERAIGAALLQRQDDDDLEYSTFPTFYPTQNETIPC